MRDQETESRGFWTTKKIVWMSISVALLIVGLCTCPFSCVPAGHVGVIDVFGSVRDDCLRSGFNFPVNPLAKVINMPVRTIEVKEELSVPTKEGLIVGLHVSVLYSVQPEKAVAIYKTLGRDYDQVIIHPYIRNVVRDIVADFTSEDLYFSQGRKQITQNCEVKLREAYNPRGFNMEQLLMRDVQLPKQVLDAIEKKMMAKQQSEQMEFVLTKEKQEAERKAIEAGGLAKAQSIIAQSLTIEYLQWKYIESVKALADSPNNTFVITPFDEKLVPMLNMPATPHQPNPRHEQKAEK